MSITLYIENVIENMIHRFATWKVYQIKNESYQVTNHINNGTHDLQEKTFTYKN